MMNTINEPNIGKSPEETLPKSARSIYPHYEKHASSLGKIIYSDLLKERLTTKLYFLAFSGFFFFLGAFMLFNAGNLSVNPNPTEKLIVSLVGLFLLFFGCFFLVGPRARFYTNALLVCEHGILHFKKHDFGFEGRCKCYLYKEMIAFNITQIDHHSNGSYTGSNWEISINDGDKKVCYTSISESFVDSVREFFGRAYLSLKTQEFLTRGEYRLGNDITVQKDRIILSSGYKIKYNRLQCELYEKYKWGVCSNKSGNIKYLRIGDGSVNYENFYDLTTQMGYLLLQRIMDSTTPYTEPTEATEATEATELTELTEATEANTKQIKISDLASKYVEPINPQISDSEFYGLSFLFVVLLGFIGLCFYSLYFPTRSLFWPSCEGTIQEVNVFHSGTRGYSHSNPWRLSIKYDYSVDDKKYTGNRYRYAGIFSNEASYFDRKFIETLPSHATVRVYYDPNLPQRSLLYPGWNYCCFVFIAFPGLMSIMAAFVLAAYLKKHSREHSLGAILRNFSRNFTLTVDKFDNGRNS